MIAQEFATRIEAKPADPQHARAEHGVGQVVGPHVFAAETFAASEYQGAHQRGDSRANVHDSAASKIKGTASDGMSEN